jgi:hypothetical protein
MHLHPRLALASLCQLALATLVLAAATTARAQSAERTDDPVARLEAWLSERLTPLETARRYRGELRIGAHSRPVVAARFRERETYDVVLVATEDGSRSMVIWAYTTSPGTYIAVPFGPIGGPSESGRGYCSDCGVAAEGPIATTIQPSIGELITLTLAPIGGDTSTRLSPAAEAALLVARLHEPQPAMSRGDGEAPSTSVPSSPVRVGPRLTVQLAGELLPGAVSIPGTEPGFPACARADAYEATVSFTDVSRPRSPAISVRVTHASLVCCPPPYRGCCSPPPRACTETPLEVPAS